MYEDKYKKILLILLTCICLMILISPVIITKFYLPDEINMIVGREYNIDFNIPVKATIKAQDDDLILDDDINKVLTEIQSVNLNEPLTIKASEKGSAKLKINLLGSIPIKTVLVSAHPHIEVIPGGEIIGIEVHSMGVCVVDTSEFVSPEGPINPAKGKIKKGDRIISINDNPVNTKEDFREYVEGNLAEPIVLDLIRENKCIRTEVTPEYSSTQGSYKLGIWIKDTVQGLGTLTYVEPTSGKFGALGHGITDTEFEKIIPISYGKIMEAEIDGIKQGEIGVPGEISGIIDTADAASLGSIMNNTNCGIFGVMDIPDIKQMEKELVEVATSSEIKEGSATILANLTGEGVRSYDVKVQKIAKHISEPSKGMVIKIVDEELLDITKGIIQGMSGSPIIQNGKIIGAISHVFVNDPTTGYGIFIENMINKQS
ncbi:SpoIVB peptidase [Candidatus Epulonipiscioides saccharophilum]|nr:SpoIVB peptidase [Epulopiscium sp. SCG-B10WGA-EpuloB]